MKKTSLFLYGALLACGPREESAPRLQIEEWSWDGKAHTIASPLAVGADLELVVREPNPADPGYLRDATIRRIVVAPEGALTWTTNPQGRLVVHGVRAADAILTIESTGDLVRDYPLLVAEPARSNLVVSGSSQEDIPEPLRNRNVRASFDSVLHLEPAFFDAAGARLLGFGLTRWQAEPAELVAVKPFLPRTNTFTVESQRKSGRVSVRPERPDVGTLDVVFDAEPPRAEALFVSHHRCAVDHCLPYEALALDRDRGRLAVEVGTVWTIDVHALDADGAVVLTHDAAVTARVVAGAIVLKKPWRLVSFHNQEIRADAPGDSTIELAYAGRTVTVEVHAE